VLYQAWITPEILMPFRKYAFRWSVCAWSLLVMAAAAGAADAVTGPDAAPAAVAAPSEAPFWVDKNCLRQTKRAWCDASILNQGWVFKSKAESPLQMKDPVFYIEFFEKDGQRLKCEISERKGAITKNECKLLAP
jgi:hypothetical protein